jgi:DNA-binding NtrC family response regulator
MLKTNKLSHADRSFLQLLAEAAAANPFSDTYDDLLLKIAECGASVPADERYQKVVSRLSDEVRRMESQGSVDVRQYSGEDRRLLSHAIMFDVFHRYIPFLDQLIVGQLAAGDRSISVGFAGELLRLLVQRGFSEDEAKRLFAILYQIRRAFYFIDRSLIGRSESMKQLRHHLWNNVFTHDIRLYERHLWNRMEDFSTMLLGETGVGKGAAAAAIGRSGFIPFDEKKGVFEESFVRGFTSLNLSQFPEALIESELFGHRKGSFTGATESHEGIFSRSSPYGAIFLDEIGDASVPVQIKLLNVLQRRTFSPVGSHETKGFRGRIIAATNRPLDQLRREGRIRDDFFYRLCSDVILVPSLRQRIGEEPAEFEDLVALIVQRLIGDAAPETAAIASRILLENVGYDYEWPGNVRELEQAVRRVLLTRHYQGGPKAIESDLTGELQAGIANGSLDADTLLSGYCQIMYRRLGTYEEVARRLKLDRRTVKAYISKADGATSV